MGTVSLQGNRTNYIKNNSGNGAIAGTPGTLPTTWGDDFQGLTGTVVGVGTESGVDYVSLRYQGTTTASYGVLYFDGNGTTLAAATIVGQSYTTSSYCKLQAGSFTNVSQIKLVNNYFSAGTVYNGETDSSPLTITTADLSTQRFSVTGNIPSINVSILSSLLFTWSIGAVIDFTIRIGLPQLETGSMTSAIRTATGAVTTGTAIATTGAGTFGKTFSSSMPGKAITATTGTLAPKIDHSQTLTGVSATTSAGAFVRTVTKTLTGIAINLRAGSFTEQNGPPLVGVHGTATAGAIARTTLSRPTLPGQSATASAGSLLATITVNTITLHGVIATTAANRFTLQETSSPTLVGVAVTSTAQSLVHTINTPLQGDGRTNWIWNNATKGADVGDNLFPANWDYSVSGITPSIIAIGTENGIPYIDIRLVGNTGDTFADFYFSHNDDAATIVGDPWTSSIYLKIVDGDLTNVTSIFLAQYHLDLDLDYVSEDDSAPLIIDDTLTRYQINGVVPAGAGFIIPTLVFIWTSGSDVDFTVRIGAPQLEQSPTASSPIFTFGSTVTTGDGRTNWIINNTMLGADIDDNRLPDTWANDIPGIERSVLGVGNVDGVNYVDVQYSGTTSDIYGNIFFGTADTPVSIAPALPDEVWTSSAFLSIIDGDLTNVTDVHLYQYYLNETFDYQGQDNSDALSVDSSLTRYSVTGTTVDNTTRILPLVSFAWASGVDINFTLRIGSPQLETGSSPTSIISTIDGPVTNEVLGTTDVGSLSFSLSADNGMVGVHATTSAGDIRNIQVLAGAGASAIGGSLAGSFVPTVLPVETSHGLVTAAGILFADYGRRIPGAIVTALAGGFIHRDLEFVLRGPTPIIARAGNFFIPHDAILTLPGTTVTVSVGKFPTTQYLVGVHATMSAGSLITAITAISHNIFGVSATTFPGRFVVNADPMTGAGIVISAGSLLVQLYEIVIDATSRNTARSTFLPPAKYQPFEPMTYGMADDSGTKVSTGWLHKLTQTVNSMLGGNMNVVSTITFEPNTDTTTLMDTRIGAGTYIQLMPQSQNAALDTWWFSPATSGSIVINHDNSPDEDRVFKVVFLGSHIVASKKPVEIISQPPAPAVNPVPFAGYLPTGTPYERWTELNYTPSDLIAEDHFSDVSLNTENWNPWLGGFFGSTAKFYGEYPCDPPADNPLLSMWTMWPYSNTVDSPDFDGEYFDPFPYAVGSKNTTGIHLQGGPGTVTAEGGLIMTASPTEYAATTLRLSNVYALSAWIQEGTNILKINSSQLTFTKTATAQTDIGELVLHVDSTEGILFGMQVDNITNPDTFPPSGGGYPFVAPWTVKSVTDTTVTTFGNRGAGVPTPVEPGDTLVFTTYFQNQFYPDTRYYIIGDGIPPNTTFIYQFTPSTDWATITSTGNQIWSDAACDPTCTNVAACVNGGGIWTSFDSGTSWTISGAPFQNWISCCISDDGTKLAAVSGAIYLSIDSGITWTVSDISNLPPVVESAGVTNWTGICCSADGSILYATGNAGGFQAVVKSTDSGASWDQLTILASQFVAVSCSADGAKVLAVAQLPTSIDGTKYGGIFVSSDSGATWTEHFLEPYSEAYVGCTMTPDGMSMMVGEYGVVYSSIDGGTTWVNQFFIGDADTSGSTSGAWFGMAISSDGKQALAANKGTPITNNDGHIFYTPDYGITFSAFYSLSTGGINRGQWSNILANGDFTKFLAFDAATGTIYKGTGELLITVNMSNNALTTNKLGIFTTSQLGWASAAISSGPDRKMILPETGGLVQWRAKYPDTSHGANAIVTLYIPGDIDTGYTKYSHADFSLETGYTRGPTSPNSFIEFGLFNKVSGGIILPFDNTLDFHSWAIEIWPDISFSIFLDGVFQYSTSRCIFNGSITGSTLTVSDVMILGVGTTIGSAYQDPVTFQQVTVPVVAGGVDIDYWVRWAESPQTLYIHSGSGDTWTVYDKATEAPVNLNVPTTIMAISSQKTRFDNSNASGPYCMMNCLQMETNVAEGFHSPSDWVEFPGPFQFKWSGIAMHRLPGT